MIRLARSVLALLIAAPVVIAATDDDWPDDPWERARTVNEGELAFLTEPPAGRVLRIENRLDVRPAGLLDGWVGLRQCHTGLDPVPDAEVVYGYRAMRGLRVERAERIGAARVEGNSVQLHDVEAGARLCISAEVRILEDVGKGRWRLRSGPFHRRFLDGYYPVHLLFEVTWPASRLALRTVDPAPRAGFAVEREPGRLLIDTLFEGRLTVRLEWISPPTERESG